MRGTGCNRKPLIIKIQLESFAKIEFGWIAQPGCGECSVIGGGDGEFTGIKLIRFLAGAVAHLDNGMTCMFANAQDKRGARLGARAR